MDSRKLISNVRVAITETSTVDVSLEVGTISEQAVISASSRSSKRTARNWAAWLTRARYRSCRWRRATSRKFSRSRRAPSLTLPDNTALGRNSQNVSVNGARTTQNDFEINGIDANNMSQNNAISVAVPAPETIQEFKVQTSLYDATSDAAAAAMFRRSRKAAATNFTALPYEYFRHDALNANNPFLKAAGVKRPVLKRNVFGGLLGGPVKTDRHSSSSRTRDTRAQRRIAQQSDVERLDRAGPD